MMSTRAIANYLRAPWQIDATGLVLCAALTYAAYLLGVRPAVSRHVEQRTRDAQLVEARERVSALTASTRMLRTQIVNVDNVLLNTEVKLYSASAINQRLAEITSLASECGLEVQLVQTGTIIPSQRYAQLPIELAGTGTYRASAWFLHRLRKALPDTAVHAFEFSGNPTESNGLISYQLRLNWYVQPR
jgi:Tfp pilus assembly protein PilO